MLPDLFLQIFTIICIIPGPRNSCSRQNYNCPVGAIQRHSLKQIWQEQPVPEVTNLQSGTASSLLPHYEAAKKISPKILQV